MTPPISDRAARLAATLADRYRIERELGAGGMATVYLAHDIKLGRRVALKVLRPELAAVIGPERFLAEIRTTANLHHAHILPLHDSGEVDGTAYYVMPFVEGESLRERLSREGQIPVDEAIRITREVASALDHAHRHGVIHRDIKPDNILLQEGTATLADFGIALAVNQAGGNRLTETGLSLGTPQYMSPEQATGDRTLDARSDIYALGAVLYEMLTGEPPHAGATAQAVVARILTERPTAVRVIRETVPPSVEAAVMKALAKSPVDRFQHAADLAAALTDPHPDAAVKAVPPTGTIAAAVVGVAILAAVFLFVLRNRAESIPQIGRSEQFTTDAGLEIQPSLSPDGRLVAFAAGNSVRMRIFIRPIGGGRTIPLSDDSTSVETEPKWSPDGTQLLFLSRGSASVAPALGGSSRVIIPPSSTARVESANWTPNPDEVAFVRGDSLMVMTLSGGSTRFLGSGHGPLHSCTWSSDGKWIACVSQNRLAMEPGPTFGNLAPSQILLFPSRGGEPAALTESGVNTSPVFSGDGRLLYFLSNSDGPRDIYAIRLSPMGRARGKPLRVTTGLGANAISMASDGKRMTYAVYTARANIWSVPIVPGPGGTDAPPTQVTSGSQVIENLQLSPDGRWLVYDSDLKGNSDIYRIPVGGGTPEQLTDNPVEEFAPELSPDGRLLVYHSWQSGSRDIEVKPLGGGPIEHVTSSPAQESYPRWTPDGSGILYFDQQSRGAFLIRRSGAGTWGAPELLTQPGQRPDISPDGTMLVFSISQVSNRAGPIRIMPVSGGAQRTLTPPGEAEALSGAPIWSLDGKSIFYKFHDVNGLTSFWSLPAAGGPPRLIARLTDPNRQSGRYDVTTDGQRLFFPIEDRQSDIFVAELIKQ